MEDSQSNSWLLRPFSTDDEILKNRNMSAKVELLGLRKNSTFKVEFPKFGLWYILVKSKYRISYYS